MSNPSIPSPTSPVDVSLFNLLRDELHDRVAILRCTKMTMVHLSHTLEDMVMRHQLPAMIFTGFQESSHWREETERYRALAEVVQQICIFAGGTLPAESDARHLHVTLAGGDPLRQEWFLVILSTEFSAVLCGQDRQEPFDQEPLRQFDTIWTFDPPMINRILDLLEKVVAHYRPERLADLQENRRRFALQPPDPSLMTYFSTEMIRFEEELHQSLHAATRALDDQLRWRETLTEMLVHDLRTPLQGLIQTISFLQQAEGLERQALEEMLTMAAQSSTNLSRMVQLILDTNRLEAGHVRLELTPLQPQQLCSDALSGLDVLLRMSEITFEIEIEPSLKVVWGDGTLLLRVLQNLIGNAIKYTPAGGTITLNCRLARNGNQVELRVRDSGIGIPPNAVPHLFERYYQVRRSDRRGSGIGLYFCRLAVEAHGGSIRADSRVGTGTTITVRLPVRPLQLT